jgi:glutaredoxin
MVANGWLRAVGSDFFTRTELGRLAVADVREITLLTRKGCHLCEVAQRRMQPVLAEFGVTLRIVDIDADPVLRERYTNDVPVIFAGPEEISRHRIDLERLRESLERSATSP